MLPRTNNLVGSEGDGRTAVHGGVEDVAILQLSMIVHGAAGGFERRLVTVTLLEPFNDDTVLEFDGVGVLGLDGVEELFGGSLLVGGHIGGDEGEGGDEE